MRLRLAVVAVIGALGCQPRTVNPGERPDPATVGLTGGTLVFEDAFEGSAIGPDWRAQGGAWSIESGWLAVAEARNDALWLQRALPERVRIEFDAKSLSDDGDLKFEVFGDGLNHQSGYVAIFGGWRNSLNIIARLDEHGDDRLVGQDGVRVTRDQVYRMALVRTDARVRWFVDGQPFLTFDDPEPLVGESHDHFGFNDWSVPLRFDNVRVFDLGAAP